MGKEKKKSTLISFPSGITKAKVEVTPICCDESKSQAPFPLGGENAPLSYHQKILGSAF